MIGGWFRRQRAKKFTQRHLVKAIYRALLDKMRPLRSHWHGSVIVNRRGPSDHRQASLRLARLSARKRRQHLRRVAFAAARWQLRWHPRRFA